MVPSSLEIDLWEVRRVVLTVLLEYFDDIIIMKENIAYLVGICGVFDVSVSDKVLCHSLAQLK